MKMNHYKKMIVLLFVLALVACGGETLPPDEPKAPAPDSPSALVEDTSLEVAEPYQFTFQVTDDPNSRWQDITLTITDEHGKPVPDLSVQVDQIDLDFIYSASGSAFIAWMEETASGWQLRADSPEKIAMYNDLGFNNVEYYPWWMWTGIETADNQWQFEAGIDDGQFTAPDFFYANHPKVRFHTFWVGPQFHQPGMVPDWINYHDDVEFRTQFSELITATFELNPSGHFTLYEIGVEINDWSAWDGKGAWDISDQEWDWAIDFLKYESELIRSLDPNARISIDFDIITYFDNCEACVLENWIERAIEAGVDFDVLGFEFHPGANGGEPATVEELKAFLESLDKYGKDYYFWELTVRSWGELEKELHLGEWVLPPVDEYTEEYQKELYLEFMQYFIENPRIIGNRFVVFKDAAVASDPVYSELIGQTSGLLRGDLTPKPAYYTLKDYWQSLLTSHTGSTDDNGQVTFNAIPGMFDVNMAEQTVSVHLHHQDSMFSQVDDDPVVMLDEEIPSASASPAVVVQNPTEASSASDTLSPCDLSKDIIGQEVTVAGRIEFVDQGSAGVFFELVDQGCRLGAIIMKSDWNQWPKDIQTNFQRGKKVQVTGILGVFQGELELEIFGPPIFLD